MGLSNRLGQLGLGSSRPSNLSEDLQPGWRAVLDTNTNQWYYFNDSTQQSQWEAPLARKSYTKSLRGLSDLVKSKEAKAAVKSGLAKGKKVMAARKYGNANHGNNYSQQPDAVLGGAAAGAVGGAAYAVEGEEHIQQIIDEDGNTATDEIYVLQGVDEDGHVVTYAEETIYENGEAVATHAEETVYDGSDRETYEYIAEARYNKGVTETYEAVSYVTTSYDSSGGYDGYDSGGGYDYGFAD